MLQRIKKTEKQTGFDHEQLRRHLRGDTPEQLPEDLRPLDAKDTLDVHDAILNSAGCINLAESINDHFGDDDLPGMSREREEAVLDQLASRHRSIDHDANFIDVGSQLAPLFTHISGMVAHLRQGMLPSTIRVEECYFDIDKRHGKFVQSQGIVYAQKLSDFGNDAVPDSNAIMNIWEHRAGVISAFDLCTARMLDNEKPPFFGSKSELIRRFSGPALELSTTHSRNDNAEGFGSGQQPADGIEELLKSTHDGGLHYMYHCTKVDPDLLAPAHREKLVYALAIRSPTMIRLLQILHKHVRQEENRVLVMVETIWIQNFVTSLLVHFGFVAVTIRASDDAASCQEIINKWDDPESELDVFVSNVSAMSAATNLHRTCHLGIFLNWHLDPDIMEQHFQRLDGPGQYQAVEWTLLKQANSYQDNVERLVVQKWLATASSKYDLPQWMDYEILEICLCELMKSQWHQPFNRYAWVVEHEFFKSEMSYHGDKTIILGHVFSMLARLFFTTHDKAEQDFYRHNVGAFVEAAKFMSDIERLKYGGSLSHKFKTVQQATDFLRVNDETFVVKMAEMIRPVIRVVKGEMKSWNEGKVLLARNARLRVAVRARQVNVTGGERKRSPTDEAGTVPEVAYQVDTQSSDEEDWSD
ncbi:hypothetical protein FSHL1_007020 [Fusarium sambucinum]